MQSRIWWLNSLLGAVDLIKNANIDKHKYCGYGIRFDRLENFSLSGGFGRNVTIFGFDVSSSAHIDNKENNILILGEGPTQGLYDITLTAKKNIWSMLLKMVKTKLSLSLHYNGANASYIMAYNFCVQM